MTDDIKTSVGNVDEKFKNMIQKNEPENKVPLDSETEEEQTEKFDGDLSYLNGDQKSEDDDEDESDEDHDESDEESNDQDPDNKKKKKTGFEKRIHRFTKENATLRRELDEMKALMSKNFNQGQNQDNRQNQRQIEQDIQEPNPENYHDIREYHRDHAKFVKEETRREVQREFQQRQLIQESQRINSEWANKVKVAKNRYSDYESMKNSNIPVTPEVKNIIMTHEHGPDIAYYLYKNEGEAHALNAMPPYQRIMKVGEIGLKIKNALTKLSAKKVSSAPEPITPVTNKASRTKKLEDMDTDEYIKEYRRRKK